MTFQSLPPAGCQLETASAIIIIIIIIIIMLVY
jgi:hypothetical protein